MKKLTMWSSAGVVLALGATLLILSVTKSPALASLRGGGPLAFIGCLACAGGAIAGAIAGAEELAWVLWTRPGTAAAMFCVATCIAAVK